MGSDIYVGGFFDNGNGVKHLAKLDLSGTFDASFQAGLTARAQNLSQTIDGDILFEVNQNSQGWFVRRVNASGVLDSTYSVDAFGMKRLHLPGGDVLFAENGSLLRVADDGTVDLAYTGIAGRAFNANPTDMIIANDGAVWVVGGFSQFNGVPANGVIRLSEPDASVIFTQQPADVAVNLGENAMFTAQASGTALITEYQWYFNGTPISDGASYAGTTTRTLTVLGVDDLDEGSYTLEATNAAGQSAVSDAGLLSVFGAPEVVFQDASPLVAFVGDSLTIEATLVGAAPIDYEFFFEGVSLSTGTQPTQSGTISISIPSAALSDRGSYTIEATNGEGSAVSEALFIDVRQLPNSLVSGFVGISSFSNGAVTGIAPLSDGGAYLAGNFSSWNFPTSNFRSFLVRVDAQGAIVPTFNPSISGSTSVTYRVVELGNSAVIVSGPSISLDGATDQRLVKMDATGARDTAFTSNIGSGPNDEILDLAVDAQGRIYVYGRFDQFNGTPTTGLVRLSPDGVLDTGFTPALSGQSFSGSLKLTPSGDLLVLDNGALVKVSSSGVVDGAFSISGGLTSVAVDSQGRILVSSSAGIERYSSEGVLDSSFSPTESSSFMNYQFIGIDVNADDQVLMLRQNQVLLFNTDGTRETSFSGVSFSGSFPNRDAAVFEIGPVGGIWVGGSFTSPTRKYAKYVGTPADVAITQQPTDAIVEPATPASFTVAAIGTGPLAYQWYRDGVALSDNGIYAGTSTDTLTIANAAEQMEGSFSVEVINTLTTVSKTSLPAELVVLGLPEFLTQPQSQAVLIDTSFTLTAQVQASAPFTVAWSKDGAPLSNGGSFSGVDTLTLTVDPASASTAGDYTVEITNSFGSATSDPAEISTYINPASIPVGFNAPIFNSTIRAILPLPSGQVLVGGGFSSVTDSVSTYSRNGLALVNQDGTIDPAFDLAASNVYDLELQADGKVLLAGQFTTVGGVSRPRHARLNSDLTLDTGYAPSASPNSTILTILEDADGSIWIGGFFSSISGTANPSAYIAKLDSSGEPVAGQSSANSVVYDLVNAQDGDIFVAGSFTSFLGEDYLVKINRDLTLDTAFNPSIAFAYAVDEAPNGDVFLAHFNEIAKFSASGVEDTSYPRPSEWGTINTIYDLAVQENGRVIGGFQSSPYLGRVEPNGALDTTFDQGSGLNGTVEVIALQNTGAIWVGGGFTTYNGVSVGRLIKLEGDLVDIAIRQNPTDQAEDEGTSASFTVVAETFGGEPIGYQWRKDGVALVDGGDINGATSATLTVSNLEASDEGEYDVIVTNLTTTSAATSQAAGLTVLAAPEILSLSGDQNLEQNDFLSLSVEAIGASGLSFQWRKNGEDIPGANGPSYELAQAQVSDSGSYTVALENSFGSLVSDPIAVSVILAPAGIVAGFSEYNFNSTVSEILPLLDGRTLVGGSFSSITYDGTFYSIRYLALINADGSLDTSFNLSPNNTVTALSMDSQGRVLIGGNFTNIGGQSKSRFARLNSALEVDSSFGGSNGPNTTVNDIAEAPDGSLYLAGNFSQFAGQPGTAYLCRVDETGALDPDFVSEVPSSLERIVVQADGKILAGGSFSISGRSNFARFNDDGSLDLGFAGGFPSAVTDIDQLSDGSWIVVGSGGNAIRRYDANGTVDGAWSASVNSAISSVAVEDDDQLVIGGGFTFVEGQSQNRVARLNSDGSLDTSFDIGAGANNQVSKVALEPLGAIWLGGNFSEYRGEPAIRLVRLYGDLVEVAIVRGPRQQVVDPGATATFTVLAASEDTLSYQWQRNGVDLVDGGDISGATTATLQIANAEEADESDFRVIVTNTVTSASKTSSAAPLIVLGAPEILEHPEAQVLEWETTLELTVEARGVGPLTYQWFKDGVALVDDSRISGATSAMLTISPTEVADTAGYEVSVSNGLGEVTSLEVAVNVFIPQGKSVPGLSIAGFNSTVRAILPLGDGRALIGGQFSSPRLYLALLNPDGTVDSSFNLGLNNLVYALKFDSQGRILVGGDFTTIDGQPYQRVARLNADLTLDTSFEVFVGPGSSVYDLVEAEDGSVWAGGAFSSLSDGSTAPAYLLKLDTLGQIDSAYSAVLNGTVWSVESLADGNLVVGGQFSNYENSGRNYLVKLDQNGALVESFNPSINNFVYDLHEQPDGKLLVGGRLSGNIQRLNTDGSVDSSFGASVTTPLNSYVWAIDTQLDGAIYLAGQFSTFDGLSVSRLARLNRDGSLDVDFETGTGFNNTAFAVATEPLGNVWFGGQFNIFRADSVPRLVKLNGYEAAVGITSEPLPVSVEGGQTAVFTVAAGGTGPLSYQWRKNGVDLPGETGTSLSISGVIEADEGAYDVVVTNATAGLSVTSRAAELTYLGAPEILYVSEGVSLFVGDSVLFEVVARGAATLNYQWNFNGSPIAGQTQPTLDLTGLELSDAGDYTVTISNGIGSITSSPIELNVSINAAAFDPDFRSANNGNGAANNLVYAVEVLSDGSAVVGGSFSSIAGGTASRLAKIGADGELVAGWGATFNSTVQVVRELSDGKFLVGGNFSRVNNDTAYAYLVRLNSDGTLDTSYDPNLNQAVYDIAVFANDAVMVVGSFTSVDGASRAYVAKLDAGGALDTDFKVTATNWITEVEIDSTGRVYLASGSRNAYPVDDGSSVFDTAYLRFFRSTAAGRLDTSYTPAPNNYIEDMKILDDDTVLVGGSFSQIFGTLSSYFARLSVDGGVDASSPSLSLNNSVSAFAVDSSGNYILSGGFTVVQGESQFRLTMVDSSGVLVETFFTGSGLNSQANVVEVDSLGKIWLGGGFSSYNGMNASRLTRLTGYTAPDVPDTPTFATFIANSGLTGSDAAFNYDFDKDGLVNGLEFLLGGNPASPDSGLMPSPTVQSGSVLSTGDTENYLTLRVSIPEGLMGEDWTVEVSASLPFSNIENAVQVGTPSIAGGKASYLFRMPWPTSDPVGTGFMRLVFLE